MILARITHEVSSRYNPRPVENAVDEQFELAVVIPTLNEEGAIEACLESVGEHSGVEIVVSDGGSTDATRALASRRAVRVVVGESGRGPQLNRGAEAASAERLLFLHADCRLPEGWRDAAIRALGDPETALACFRLHTEPGGVGGSSRLKRAWLRILDLRSNGFGLPYGDQAYAVRRDVFELVGGFPGIPLMEDFAFARACRRLGRIRRLPMEVRTTARRFERHHVRTRLMTATFPTLFRLGVSPFTLARWYREVR